MKLQKLSTEGTDANHNRMITLKYAAKPFSMLDKVSQGVAIKKLLYSIHVITGIQLPGNDLLQLLVSEVSKMVIADYPMLNDAEMIEAFRQSEDISQYGKPISVWFIKTVLQVYSDKRYQVSLEEESRVQPPAQKIYTDTETDNDYRMWAEQYYQRLLNGSLESIPEYVKVILVKDGLIKSESDVHTFLHDKLSAGFKNIYVRL